VDTWEALLAAALALNAALGFGYRVYRLSKGGHLGDVIGQALLGVVLLGLALAVVLEQDWAVWPALGYALLFGLIVMPLWVLAVLIPMGPRGIDYAFTASYWLLLILVGVAAVLA
jgi:hypothetical protein